MSDQTNTSEVVIIGGGIYGTSLAYQLACAGKTVTLLEAGEIACGASGGPGERGVRANGRDLRELPICAIAQQLWGDYQERIRGRGWVPPDGRPQGLRRLLWPSRARGARPHGGEGGRPDEPWHTFGGSDARPDAGARAGARARHVGAIYCPNDGVGDHTFATRQFATEAAKAGAVIRTGAKSWRLSTRIARRRA